MQSITCRIGKHNRIVVAVSEEIVALQAAVGAEDGIRAEEPADIGIVSVCSAGTKKSRTIFAQLILYVIRLRVCLYVSD